MDFPDGRFRFRLHSDDAVARAITTMKSALRRLPDAQRQHHFAQIEALLATVDPGFVPADFRLAGIDDLRALDPSVLEIGSHSYSHPQLDKVEDPEVLRREISGAKAKLESWLGRPVLHFCYPAGSYNSQTLAEVKRAGHVTGLTVEYGVNGPGASPFELHRLGLTRDLDQFRCRLSGLEGTLLRVKARLPRSKSKFPFRLAPYEILGPPANSYRSRSDMFREPASEPNGGPSGAGRHPMRLVVFSHKPTWASAASPSGFATDGGFPFQMKAISELFDSTVLLVPCQRSNPGPCESPLVGHNLSIAALTVPHGHDLQRKLVFPFWLLRNLPLILRQFRQADAVHAPIPGDVGTVGMVLSLVSGKPLFVRHCGNWFKPETWAEHFWRWFMERYAGGKNVMLATGGGTASPSVRNPAVRWVFSSSLTEAELKTFARKRACPAAGGRLIIVARQEKAKGAGTVIQSLPLLASRFANVTFEIVGQGPAIPDFRRIAAELGVADRVEFAGKLGHDEVMKRLQFASLFVFPSTSSEGFPKAVLEALATGLPVISTGVSVLPHLLGTGCGVVLDEPSPQAVARAIEYALGDPARYEAMSRQAIQTARQYSLEAWQDAIGGYLEAAWGPLRKRSESTSGSAETAGPIVDDPVLRNA